MAMAMFPDVHVGFSLAFDLGNAGATGEPAGDANFAAATVLSVSVAMALAGNGDEER